MAELPTESDELAGGLGLWMLSRLGERYINDPQQVDRMLLETGRHIGAGGEVTTIGWVLLREVLSFADEQEKKQFVAGYAEGLVCADKRMRDLLDRASKLMLLLAKGDKVKPLPTAVWYGGPQKQCFHLMHPTEPNFTACREAPLLHMHYGEEYFLDPARLADWSQRPDLRCKDCAAAYEAAPLPTAELWVVALGANPSLITRVATERGRLPRPASQWLDDLIGGLLGEESPKRASVRRKATLELKRLCGIG